VFFSNASDIDYAKKTFARVRKNRVNELTTFLTNHNSAYVDARRCQSKIESMEDDYIHPDMCVKDDEGNLIKEVINDTSRVNTVNDSSDDTSVVETSGGLFDLRSPASPDEDAGKEVDPIRRFQVLHSNTYLGSRDSKYYGGAFPDLFCFGIGTPNSPRRVPVSLELALRHLLLLSGRRFAQSAIFSLVAFDELARCRAHSNLAVKLRANPKAANEMVSLSTGALTELLLHNEKLEQVTPNNSTYGHDIWNTSQSKRCKEHERHGLAIYSHGLADTPEQRQTWYRDGNSTHDTTHHWLHLRCRTFLVLPYRRLNSTQRP